MPGKRVKMTKKVKNKNTPRRIHKTRRKVSRRKYHRKRTNRRLKMRGGEIKDQVIRHINKVERRINDNPVNTLCEHPEECGDLRWFCSGFSLDSEKAKSGNRGDTEEYHGTDNPVVTKYGPGFIWKDSAAGVSHVFLSSNITVKHRSSRRGVFMSREYYVEITLTNKSEKWKFRYDGEKQTSATEACKMEGAPPVDGGSDLSQSKLKAWAMKKAADGREIGEEGRKEGVFSGNYLVEASRNPQQQQSSQTSNNNLAQLRPGDLSS